VYYCVWLGWSHQFCHVGVRIANSPIFPEMSNMAASLANPKYATAEIPAHRPALIGIYACVAACLCYFYTQIIYISIVCHDEPEVNKFSLCLSPVHLLLASRIFVVN